MCGIVGYIGKKYNALNVLISGLERLEYRGYDSAGIAYIEGKTLKIEKEKGKISNLKSAIDVNIPSNLGIGHTRWATHGIASKINSHPHKVGKITIVHNGIIENYEDLRNELINNGVKFKSETDTEVACALLNKLYEDTNDMNETLCLFQKKVKGTYALGIICDDDYNTLYALKNKSPLIIAFGENENYIASDVPAILEFTNKYITLNDGEFAKITENKVTCYKDNEVINKKINEFEGSAESIEKNGYEHFMLKEIFEQPEVFKKTVFKYTENGIKSLIENMPDFKKYKSIKIVACGSAMHAGMVGKSLIEEYGNIPVDVEIASEFRYKKLFINKDTLVILVSQSGETADTLAALEIAKEKGCDTLGIINVLESSIARSSDIVLYTKAGSEIAVATTKAYSAQITLLSLIALNIACSKKLISEDEIKEILSEIKNLPIKIQSLLDKKDDYKEIAKKIYNNNSIDPKKIDEYFNDDLKPSSLVIERIKNNSYYNILDKDSNKYSILYRVNGIRRKISITANSDGMIDYNELLKIKNIIGGPYIELSIEDLYLVLYKLSKESLIDVDLTSLRTSIQVNRLNREFNDKLQEFKSFRKHLVKA